MRINAALGQLAAEKRAAGQQVNVDVPLAVALTHMLPRSRQGRAASCTSACDSLCRQVLPSCAQTPRDAAALQGILAGARVRRRRGRGAGAAPTSAALTAPRARPRRAVGGALRRRRRSHCSAHAARARPARATSTRRSCESVGDGIITTDADGDDHLREPGGGRAPRPTTTWLALQAVHRARGADARDAQGRRGAPARERGHQAARTAIELVLAYTVTPIRNGEKVDGRDRRLPRRLRARHYADPPRRGRARRGPRAGRGDERRGGGAASSSRRSATALELAGRRALAASTAANCTWRRCGRRTTRRSRRSAPSAATDDVRARRRAGRLGVGGARAGVDPGHAGRTRASSTRRSRASVGCARRSPSRSSATAPASACSSSSTTRSTRATPTSRRRWSRSPATSPSSSSAGAPRRSSSSRATRRSRRRA